MVRTTRNERRPTNNLDRNPYRDRDNHNTNNTNVKLYTEEQVYDAISKAFRYKSNIEILNSLTPIELPTEDEIKEYSLHYSEMQEDVSDKLGKYLVKAVHIDGANWVINKIKGGDE